MYAKFHDAVTKAEIYVNAETTWIVRKATTGTTHVISSHGAMHPVSEDVETAIQLLKEAGEKNGSV